jgi:hypothetical protein
MGQAIRIDPWKDAGNMISESSKLLPFDGYTVVATPAATTSIPMLASLLKRDAKGVIESFCNTSVKKRYHAYHVQNAEEAGFDKLSHLYHY